MTHPVVVAVLNHKGGVGKTTTAVNLAAAWAAAGRSVLLVDMDPQGNAGAALGIDRARIGRGTAELLRGEGTPAELAVATAVPGLKLVGSAMQLATADIRVGGMAPEFALREALAKVEGFDHVVVDCPPSFGILSLNALVAADKVLIPVQAESFALEGLNQVLFSIRRVQDLHHPDLRYGVVLTMLDPKERLSQLVAQEVRAHLGRRVLETAIPREERISEAAFRGMPVLVFDPACAGALAYMRLAGETLYRLENLRDVPETDDSGLEPSIESFLRAAAGVANRLAGEKHRERSDEALARRVQESAASQEVPGAWGEPLAEEDDKALPLLEAPRPAVFGARSALALVLLALLAVGGLALALLEWPRP
ncbi:MAG: ParA family protein [Magnetospirillum sp. WYHS-4]